MSDFGIPYVYAAQTISAAVLLPVTGLALIGYRFYVRKREGDALGIDDWLLLPAALGECGLAVLLIIGVAKKIIGYPTPPDPNAADPQSQLLDISPDQEFLTKVEYAYYLIMIASFGFVKLAVLCFYRRVFVVNKTAFANVISALIVISAFWTVGFFFAQAFICGRHFEYYWGPFVELEHCANSLPFLISLSVSDLATDLTIFLLPLPLLWRLHTSLKKKLKASAILVIGSLSVIASGVRLSTHIDIINAGYAKKVDVNLTFTVIFYWAMIEVGVAMIAINLPTLSHTAKIDSIKSIVSSLRSKASTGSLDHPSRSGSHGGSGEDISPGILRMPSDRSHPKAKPTFREQIEAREDLESP